MNALQFFDPFAEIHQTNNRLPHWQQRGATYFITFRLADALPRELLKDWESERKNWLRFHSEAWTAEIEREYHRRFSGAIERWLDSGHGSCVLRRKECAQVVAEALHYFDGKRVSLISFVVMPNHVHAMFVLAESQTLEKLIYSWKRFTAGKINRVLARSSGLWQRDYFDRLVRDAKHFANCVRYIRRNPRKANLPQNACILYESEVAKQIE